MKKIYINNTKRAIFFGDTVLLPGSNVSDEIDPKKFPAIEKYIDNDEIEVSEDPASAVKKANTQEAVNAIENMDPKNKKLKKNAGKRKADLDNLDEEAKAAAKKAKQKAEGKEGDEPEEVEGA